MYFLKIGLLWLTFARLHSNSYGIGHSYDLNQVYLENPGIQNNDVDFALNHKGALLDKGLTGSTYLVTQPVQGQYAVIKIVTIQAYVDDDASLEARNLWTVNQLLAWGRNTKDRGQGREWYFVMNNMGVSLEKAGQNGMPGGIYQQLKAAATKRYEQQFHMVNDDARDANFVYRIQANQWQAEIVDWLEGRWTGPKGEQPVNPRPLEIVTTMTDE